MQIETSLAQDIVLGMKEVIDQEINYIDTKGIIIASTDQNRIGTPHGGALEVIKTRQDIIVESEGLYKGTKMGVNVPVYNESQLIGVVGITGNYEEVEKYGKIIKKMTEILIKDAWLKDVSIKKRENYRIFIEQLINGSANTESTFKLASLLKFDMTSPRVAIVGSIKNFSIMSDSQTADLINIIHSILANNVQNIYNLSGSEIRIILDACSNAEYIHQLISTLINNIQERLGLTLYLGVSSICENVLNFKTSYKKASTALKWASVNSGNQIEYYDDLDLGMILTNLPSDIEQQFINKVLGKLTKQELQEYNEIISLYGKNNGSNYKTADELFIHKNTMQYKLINLLKKTGYDPRQLDDYVILSLAFKLWEFYNDGL